MRERLVRGFLGVLSALSGAVAAPAVGQPVVRAAESPVVGQPAALAAESPVVGQPVALGAESPVVGQPVVLAVAGHVQDAGGIPIAGATVRLGETTATTDAAGAFSVQLAHRPPGAPLQISAEGHETLTLALDDTNLGLTGLTLILSPARPEGAALVVRGRRVPSGQIRHSLDRETLRRVAGTGGDPLRALTLMPGFSRSPYGSGRLIVRGARENNSAVFVDGMRVPNVFHFSFGPSVFAPDMIDRIDFYPGNFPVRYGQLTGGVVDVTLRPGQADHWQGAADIDLADAGLFGQGPLGENTTVSFSLRRSYVDGVLQAGADWFHIEDATNVVPLYWDYQARVDHTPKPGQRLSLMLVGAQDELDFLEDPDSESTERITAHERWDRVKATFEAQVAHDTTLTISPSVGLDESNLAGDDDDQAATDDGNDDQRIEGTLRLELKGPLNPVWRGLGGFDVVSRTPGARVLDTARPQTRTLDGNFTMVVPSSTETTVLQVAPYLEMTGRFAFGLTVVPAVRAEMAQVEHAWGGAIDPRINVRQALNERVTGKLALGRFSQLTRSLRRPAEGGEPRLRPAQAWHYGAGVEWLVDADTTVTSDLWMSRRLASRRTLWLLAVDENGGPRGEPMLNRAQARAFGWEFLLKRAPSAPVSGWLSYSLAVVEQRQRAGDPWRRAPYDGTHRLTTVWNTHLPAGWGLGVSGTLATGYPQTLYGGTLDTKSAAYIPLAEPYATGRRMPMYHEIDLRMEKTWTGKVSEIVGYVDLINVGGATNTEGWDWDYRFAKPRPLRGMPVFPALGLQVRLL